MKNWTGTRSIADLNVSFNPTESHFSMTLRKRIFDVTLSIFGLVLLSPVFTIIALLVRISSPGEIIYRQERLGLDGNPFTIYKFRTMFMDAEKDTGPVLARVRDPRVTPIGQILRQTHLDEIPQLYNVLTGDMSLVGPRPERRFFAEEYAKKFPLYRWRMITRPGITGLAQVYGDYHMDVEEKLCLDLTYTSRCSLYLDIFILLKTTVIILATVMSLALILNRLLLGYASGIHL
ncbi:MAG: sugar transferase [Chitinophagales bacterium]